MINLVCQSGWHGALSAVRTRARHSIPSQTKENIKAPRHWPLWGEFAGDRWIPRTKGSNAEDVYIWLRHNERFSLNNGFIRW